MKKLVEIVKDETINCLKVADPKLARKLTTLEKKLNVVASADYDVRSCIELAFFAVFEMLICDIVVSLEHDDPNTAQYSVAFTNGTIEDIEIFINFSKD